MSVEQPVAGDAVRALRRHLVTRRDSLPWLFLSERQQLFTRQSVNYLVPQIAARRAAAVAPGDAAALQQLIRHYLDHRAPKHTVHYTSTAGRRFEGLWR